MEVVAITSRVEGLMDELVDVRQHDFSPGRSDRMQRIAAELKALFDDVPPGSGIDDATLAYWKGKTLTNARDTFDPSAVSLLQNAVRQNPSLFDAWNCLGECYWKDKNLASARSCFNSAISHMPNAKSFQCLSIILRSAASKSDPGSSILESVEASRSALKLDIQNGHSWYLFGNSMMSKFFAVTLDPADLLTAFKAYQKAQTAKVQPSDRNPDLYFNRANARWYLEEYALAIEDFPKAAFLDPTLTKAADHVGEIENFVTRISRQLKQHSGSPSAVTASHEEAYTNAENVFGALRRRNSRLPVCPTGPGVAVSSVQDWAHSARAFIANEPTKEKRSILSTTITQLIARQISGGRSPISLANLLSRKTPSRGILCLEMGGNVFRKRSIPCTLTCISGSEPVVVSVYHTSSDALNFLRTGDPIFIIDPVVKLIEVTVEDRVLNPRLFVAGPGPLTPTTPQLRFENLP